MAIESLTILSLPDSYQIHSFKNQTKFKHSVFQGILTADTDNKGVVVSVCLYVCLSGVLKMATIQEIILLEKRIFLTLGACGLEYNKNIWVILESKLDENRQYFKGGVVFRTLQYFCFLVVVCCDMYIKTLLFWQESVGVLNSKLSLLEPSNLDQVDVRLASVLQKLNQIGEKKSGQADLDRQNKVQGWYK